MTLAGFSLLAGAVVVAAEGPWPIWAALFGFGLLAALRRRS
jgi:uncharacterized protein (TIGR03382 family)